MNVSELKKKLEALEHAGYGDIEVYAMTDWGAEPEINNVYSVNIEPRFPVIVLELEAPDNEEELLTEGEFDSMSQV